MAQATTARDKALASAKAATVSNPSSSQYKFTPGQVSFINEYAAKTGLDKSVIAAEVFNEENGSAAQYYEGKGDNDWLNVGRTDSGNFGANDSVWSDPKTAADETAKWVQGKVSLPGFGHAAQGIVNFSKTAGQSPSAQIAALQQSGWASSGYPSLPGIYEGISGQGIAQLPGGPSVSQGAGTPTQGGQPGFASGQVASVSPAQQSLSVPMQLAMAILGRPNATGSQALSPLQLALSRQQAGATISQFGQTPSPFTPLFGQK